MPKKPIPSPATPEKIPAQKKTKKKKLTTKQAIYVKALLDGSSPTEAAIEAYPDSSYPKVQAYRSLRHDAVREKLLERLENSDSIGKVGDYLDNVMTDAASKSESSQERMSAYDRQHRASDLIIKVVGAYAPTRSQSTTADLTELLPVRGKAR